MAALSGNRLVRIDSFTSEITSHLLTNVRVVKQFLDVGIGIEGNEGREGTITFRP
jgi:RNA 3'-terminal phosphate cyclase